MNREIALISAAVACTFCLVSKSTLAATQEIWFASDIIRAKGMTPEGRMSFDCHENQAKAMATANFINSRKAPNAIVVTTEANNCRDYDDAYSKYFMPWLTSSGISEDYWLPAPGNHDYMDAQGRSDNMAWAFRKVTGRDQDSDTWMVWPPISGWTLWIIDSERNDSVAPTMAYQAASTELLMFETRTWNIPCQVVIAHRPAFSNAMKHPTQRLDTRLVEAFKRQSVELILSGHEHVYERLKPTTQTGNIVQIVAGTGGADMDTNVGWANPTKYERPDNTVTDRQREQNGVLRLILSSDQTYTVEFYTDLSQNSKPYDTYTSGKCIL